MEWLDGFYLKLDRDRTIFLTLVRVSQIETLLLKFCKHGINVIKLVQAEMSLMSLAIE